MRLLPLIALLAVTVGVGCGRFVPNPFTAEAERGLAEEERMAAMEAERAAQEAQRAAEAARLAALAKQQQRERDEQTLSPIQPKGCGTPRELLGENWRQKLAEMNAPKKKPEQDELLPRPTEQESETPE